MLILGVVSCFGGGEVYEQAREGRMRAHKVVDGGQEGCGVVKDGVGEGEDESEVAGLAHDGRHGRCLRVGSRQFDRTSQRTCYYSDPRQLVGASELEA